MTTITVNIFTNKQNNSGNTAWNKIRVRKPFVAQATDIDKQKAICMFQPYACNI